MKFKIFLFFACVLVIAISIFIFGSAGQYLIKKDAPVKADAMVVLMGSITDRSLQAAELFEKGMVNRVIIVEANIGDYHQKLIKKGIPIISNTEQMRESLISFGIPQDSIIILPGKASSTRMEACIVRDYIRRNNSIDTLLVVSSNYHTRRASMIFKSEINNNENLVGVLVYPSEYSEFSPKKWWRKRKGIKIVLLEHIKIIAFHAFYKWRACMD